MGTLAASQPISLHYVVEDLFKGSGYAYLIKLSVLA